ncbi:MAG: hypothetical protein LBF19_01440 [Prevotellaceae bacterium]|nr:hypothetical protein [Prevotellaceae bacterium]
MLTKTLTAKGENRRLQEVQSGNPQQNEDNAACQDYFELDFGDTYEILLEDFKFTSDNATYRK